MKQQPFHWHDPFSLIFLSCSFSRSIWCQDMTFTRIDPEKYFTSFSPLSCQKSYSTIKKVMYCWQPLFSLFFILAMHSPKCQQQSQEGRKALSWCRQSTFRPFLSLRCNLLSQRSFVSIVRLLAISFFNVSKLHFYLLRFITPTKELCINCQGGLSSGHHCDCTALCFHNISCFELVIIRSFCQFLHRTPRCSRNTACFF